MKAVLYGFAIFLSAELAGTYRSAAGAIPDLLPIYENLSRALYQDDLFEAQKRARELANASLLVGHEEISGHATNLEQSESLFEARLEFRAISAAIVDMVRGRFGYYVFTCQMPTRACLMKESDWVQSNTVIANPYLGQFMPNCGMLRQ